MTGIIASVPKGEYLQYGGQAIPEGVMMRSPHYFAVAVRAPNGQIVTDSDEIEKSWILRLKIAKVPFIRGAFGIIDAMILGYRSMRFAANVLSDPQYELEKVDEADSGKPETAPVNVAPIDPPKTSVKAHDGVVASNDKVVKLAVGGALVVGLALGLFLFHYLPNLLAVQVGSSNRQLVNFITEVIKITFFIGYLLLIAQLPDIKRLFQYHGAEHKAINVIENNLELTLENVQKQTRLHPRCGTSFAIVVLLVSLVVFIFLPKSTEASFLNSIVRVLIEIPFIPLIAGISYELIRFAGKMRNSSLVRAIFAPGLWTQLITTKEPTDDMVEVAMVSLQKVLDLEREREERLAPVVAQVAIA